VTAVADTPDPERATHAVRDIDLDLGLDGYDPDVRAVITGYAADPHIFDATIRDNLRLHGTYQRLRDAHRRLT
jgi:hypothetical protein